MRTKKHHRPSGRLASVILASAGLVLSVAADPLQAQERPSGEFFPLEPGNSWTYAGTIWWVPRNSRRVLEERVELEMEVVEVLDRGAVRGALLRGYPRDLVSPIGDRLEGEFALVQAGSEVHLLRGTLAREAMRRLRDRDASIADLLVESELVLDLPLSPGETFCSAEADPSARRGCWFVRSEDTIETLPVYGLEQETPRQRYVLDLRSGGEHEVRGFVPGVGFTSFAIGHAGDPSALELELVEVHLAPSTVFLKTLDLADRPGREIGTDSGRTERVEREPESGNPTRAPDPPRDGDGDGVPDDADRCQGSAVGETVDRRGCPLPPPRQVIEREGVAPVLAIRVATEEIPVPEWEEPSPACVDDREWFLGGGSIQFDGRRFDPVGTPEPIGLDNVVPAGEYDGVPLYVGRLAEEPYMDVWLPVCAIPGTYRLYADLSSTD